MTVRALLLGLLVAVGGVQAQGVVADVATDPVFEARVQRLATELRCLVCQNQSLADSNADLALQLKGQVRDQLRGGRSEQQVIDYMAERYGDFVLYRPPLRARTLLLWAGPALLVLAGVGLLVWNLRRRPATAALSEAEQARAAMLLES